MSQNGQPAGGLPLQARVDPARVAALEQQTREQSALLVSNALDVVRSLTNALWVLQQQAQAGQPACRDLLRHFATNLELARAAAAGIEVPGS